MQRACESEFCKKNSERAFWRAWHGQIFLFYCALFFLLRILKNIIFEQLISLNARNQEKFFLSFDRETMMFLINFIKQPKSKFSRNARRFDVQLVTWTPP